MTISKCKCGIAVTTKNCTPLKKKIWNFKRSVRWEIANRKMILVDCPCGSTISLTKKQEAA